MRAAFRQDFYTGNSQCLRWWIFFSISCRLGKLIVMSFDTRRLRVELNSDMKPFHVTIHRCRLYVIYASKVNMPLSRDLLLCFMVRIFKMVYFILSESICLRYNLSV